MKVVALFPQDKSNKIQKPIVMEENKVTILSKEDQKSFTFDTVFKNLSEELKSFDFTNPTLYVAVCAPRAIKAPNVIMKSITDILTSYFQANPITDPETKPSKLTIASISKDGINNLIPTEEEKEINSLADIVCTDVTKITDTIKYVTPVIKAFVATPDHSIVIIINNSSFTYIPSPVSTDGDVNSAPIIAPIKSVLSQLNNRFSSQVPNRITVDVRFGMNDSFNDNCATLDFSQIIINALKAKTTSMPSRTTTKQEKTQKTESGIPEKTEKTSIKYEKAPIHSSVHKWRQFVTREVKSKRTGKVIKVVDKQRLAFIAKQAACDPSMSGNALSELLDELNNQIAECEKFKEEVGPSLKRLIEDLEISKREEQRLSKLVADTKRHYIELRAANKTIQKAETSVSLGDPDDYRIAYDCLLAEVTDLEHELEFLRLAFPEAASEASSHITQNEFEGEEEEDNLEEEEEENPIKQKQVRFALNLTTNDINEDDDDYDDN